MINTNDFQKAVGLINKAKRVLLTTHTRPDGDACGCIAAISETLTALGKNVQILLLSELPSWYEFLFEQKSAAERRDLARLDSPRRGRAEGGPEIFSPGTADVPWPDGKKTKIDSDLIIIVDTDTYNQLPGLDKYLKKLKTKNSKLKTPVLVIDHHVTSPSAFSETSPYGGSRLGSAKSEVSPALLRGRPRADVEPRPGDSIGDVRLIDNNAAATALVVFDLLKYAGWPITKKIAQALFVAVATDTGWFQFSNTNSRVHRACAELIDAGANPSRIHRDLSQNFSPQRFKLMVAMLNTLELHLNGRFATQHLTQQDFILTGAKFSDTENLIDECRKIRSVQAIALFVELADGQIKASLRSSPQGEATGTDTPPAGEVSPKADINVQKIAEKFGGGGHKMAAGAHLPGPIEKAKKLILAEMAKQLEQST